MNWDHLACVRINSSICDFSKFNSEFTLWLVIFTTKPLKLYPNKIDITLGKYPLASYRFSATFDFDTSDSIYFYFVPPGDSVTTTSTRVRISGKTEVEILTRNSVRHSQRTYLNQCEYYPANYTIYNLLVNDFERQPKFEYNDFSTCYKVILQRLFYEKLNCVIVQFPIPTSIKPPFTFCLNIYNNNSQYLISETIKIFNDDNIKQSALDSCSKSTKKCHTHDYSVTHSSILYPLDEVIEAALVPDIKILIDLGKTLNKRYLALEEFVEEIQNSTRIEKWKENFYKVRIKSGEYKSKLILENIDYKFENFVSDVGGILGFYLGASLLTIAELIDVGIYYINMWIISRKIKYMVKS